MAWLPVIDTILKVVDKIVPDPVAKADAQLKLLQLQQSGELAELTAETELMKGQMAVNQEEAKNENLFVSGWRPGVGWVCVAAFAAKYLAGPFVFILAQFIDKTIVLPPIDMTEMLPILLGMLGLGTLRSMDKWKANK